VEALWHHRAVAAVLCACLAALQLPARPSATAVAGNGGGGVVAGGREAAMAPVVTRVCAALLGAGCAALARLRLARTTSVAQ
jgi:hypothetical protein